MADVRRLVLKGEVRDVFCSAEERTKAGSVGVLFSFARPRSGACRRMESACAQTPRPRAPVFVRHPRGRRLRSAGVTVCVWRGEAGICVWCCTPHARSSKVELSSLQAALLVKLNTMIPR